jgi:hypothetical protein
VAAEIRTETNVVPLGKSSDAHRRGSFVLNQVRHLWQLNVQKGVSRRVQIDKTALGRHSAR